MDADDDIDAKVKAEGLMEEEASDMDDDDDELEEDPAARDSPEAEWQLAKSDHQLKSEGLDQLMTLTGH